LISIRTNGSNIVSELEMNSLIDQDYIRIVFSDPYLHIVQMRDTILTYLDCMSMDYFCQA